MKSLLYLTIIVCFALNAQAQMSLAEPSATQNTPSSLTPEQFEEVRKNAQAGDSASQAILGDLYANGLGTNKDLQAALIWYQKAAEAGDPYGITQTGLFYMLGSGVDVDYEKGKQYLSQTAEQDPKAAFNLGVYYYNIAGNNFAALYWIEKAAEQGYRSAVEAFKSLQSDLKLMPGQSKATWALYKDVTGEAVPIMASFIQEETSKQCPEMKDIPPSVSHSVAGGTTLSSYKELWFYHYCDEVVMLPIEFTLNANGKKTFEIAYEVIALQEVTQDE